MVKMSCMKTLFELTNILLCYCGVGGGVLIGC